jgi:predicted P-loop ATPase
MMAFAPAAEIAAVSPKQKWDFPKGVVPLESYEEVVADLLNPRLNLRTLQVECNGKVLPEESLEAMRIVLNRKHGLKFHKGALSDTIRLLARTSAFDPVEEELLGLGKLKEKGLDDDVWRNIALHALGVEGSFEQEILQKWLVALVARAMEPGAKVDYCLILHGKEGLLKSTFFNTLAGQHFTDAMGGLENEKDDIQILHSSWISEWSEADAAFQGANKAEKVKRFISRREDNVRLPYGRTVTRMPRRAVLVGTTNRDDWATSHTGNRRFPVITVKEKLTQWTAVNREKILLRALYEWRRGTEWWFDQEQEQEITKRAEAYAPEDFRLDDAMEYLRGLKGEKCNTKALWCAVSKKAPDDADPKELKSFARAMGRLVANGANRNRESFTPSNPSHGKKGLHTVWWAELAG